MTHAAHGLILIGTIAGIACMGTYAVISATNWIQRKFGSLNA